jgi:hypothetical protein
LAKHKFYLLLAVLVAFVVIGGYAAWSSDVFTYWTGISVEPGTEIFATDEAYVHKLVFTKGNYELTATQAREGSGVFEIITKSSPPDSVKRCKAGPRFKKALASFTCIKAIRSITLSSIRESEYSIDLGTVEIHNFDPIEPACWTFRSNANGQILAVDNVQGYIVDIRPEAFKLLRGGCLTLSQGSEKLLK